MVMNPIVEMGSVSPEEEGGGDLWVRILLKVVLWLLNLVLLNTKTLKSLLA